MGSKLDKDYLSSHMTVSGATAFALVIILGMFAGLFLADWTTLLLGAPDLVCRIARVAGFFAGIEVGGHVGTALVGLLDRRACGAQNGNFTCTRRRHEGDEDRNSSVRWHDDADRGATWPVDD